MDLDVEAISRLAVAVGLGAVVGADVTARKGDITRRTTTAADGSFVLADVAGGDWIVEVAASGSRIRSWSRWRTPCATRQASR